MRSVFLGLLGFAMLIVSACDQPIITNGKYITDEQAEKITVGLSADDLLAAHGTPSYTSAIDENFWAYIGTRSQVRIFNHPEPIERRIFAMQMRGDRIAELIFLELKDGQVIYPDPNRTPTNGRTISLVEELIGNIGRF